MSTTVHDHRIPQLEVIDARDQVFELLLAERNEKGFWTGQLSASALATATALSALGKYRETCQSPISSPGNIVGMIESGLNWIMSRQNHDGGWGDTPSSRSNISTTMLVQAAVHINGRQADFEEPLELAGQYTLSKGGIEGLRQRYGKDKTFAVPILANAAIAGLVPWREVSPLPFEAAVFPQRMYHWLQLPVVSYAIPALVAIGQLKFKMDPPANPLARWIRGLSVNKGLKVLSRMQPASGGYLEAIPLTSFVVMALCHSGRPDHPVVQNGVRFLLESFRDEGDEGTWPIDTNLATWNTTLSINALTDLEKQSEDNRRDTDQCMTSVETLRSETLDWVMSCQTTKRHPFTGARPGGWGWSDLSGAVPDADDTPSALLTLKRYYNRDADLTTRQTIESSASLGLRWLLKLQNRDRGWPTFCRGWGKLPFDRSGSDITAHVIRALNAWDKEFPSFRCDKAIEKGFQFLEGQQLENGAWNPLWFGNQDNAEEENPVYGTAKVLLAYHDTGRMDASSAMRGLTWLVESQNMDGGFGGGNSYGIVPATGETATTIRSSVQETALALEALSGWLHEPTAQAACQRGLDWLIEAIRKNQCFETWPIGFYFAKLWYYERLYPLIYAASALRCVTQRLECVFQNQQEDDAGGNN